VKLAVLGAGIQARAIVHDFVQFSGAERIGVADLQLNRAQDLAAWTKDPRVIPSELDVTDGDFVGEWLAPFDAVVSAVPYRFNLELTRAAVEAKTHFTDLGGNNDIVDGQLALDRPAKTRGVLVIPDLGLAPGLVALLGADLVRSLEPPRSLELRVGGLPEQRMWPLDYRLFFSVSGLINEYIEDCRVIRGGKKLTVPGLSELETVQFEEPFGELEAFQTSGGASTLIDTLHGEVEQLDYKTLRYPGHNREMRLLQALGWFDEKPLAVGDQKVVPRQFSEALLQKKLGEVVPDVILMRITARGTKNGRPVTLVEEMIEHSDPALRLSAMARCTGFPAAIITGMVARGEIEARGAIPQEQCVDPAVVRRELAKRGITLRRREIADSEARP
jgi:lysine 6-dehydrogenase